MFILITKSPSGRLHCFGYRTEKDLEKQLSGETEEFRSSVKARLEIDFPTYVHEQSRQTCEALLDLDLSTINKPFIALFASLFLQGFEFGVKFQEMATTSSPSSLDK
ncbi:MAG: hypothetical protein WC495_02110 [Patescibacteria group bacterium]|jgi:hypothetical protein